MTNLKAGADYLKVDLLNWLVQKFVFRFSTHPHTKKVWVTHFVKKC